MALGTYQIPKEFKDEDKWFRFFTKTQLAYMVVAGILSFPVLALMHAVHLTYLGIFISVVFFMIAIVMAFVPIPTSKYMFGGGYRMSHIVARLIWKFILGRGKDLYIKNYKEEVESGT